MRNEYYIVACIVGDKTFYWKIKLFGFASFYLTDDINDAAIFFSFNAGKKRVKEIEKHIAISTTNFIIDDVKYSWRSIERFEVIRVGLHPLV